MTFYWCLYHKIAHVLFNHIGKSELKGNSLKSSKKVMVIDFYFIKIIVCDVHMQIVFIYWKYEVCFALF